ALLLLDARDDSAHGAVDHELQDEPDDDGAHDDEQHPEWDLPRTEALPPRDEAIHASSLTRRAREHGGGGAPLAPPAAPASLRPRPFCRSVCQTLQLCTRCGSNP